MKKGHPKVGWTPIGFAMAAPCTNFPEGIVLGIVLGWAPMGFAAMPTSGPSQYYFGHTEFCPILMKIGPLSMHAQPSAHLCQRR